MAEQEVKAIFSADTSGVTSGAKQAASAVKGYTDSIRKGMGNADKPTQTLGGSIKNIAVGVGAVAAVTAAVGVLKGSIGGAVERFDTLNAYPKVMKQMGFSTQDTNKSIGILKKGVDGLPTSLQEITKSSQSFAILTKSATTGAKTATALNDAFLASGASAGDASRGVQQYSQMLASGKVDLMSWRTLQETMPYALTKVANSFGLTGKSAEKDLYAKLQSGEITVDQLNQKFMELDGGVNGFANTARTATGGIGTSFTNMKNAVTNGLANMITSIDNGLKSAGVNGGIAGIFNQAKTAIISAFAVINSTLQSSMPTIVAVFKTLYDSVASVVNFIKSNSDWIAPLVVGITAGVTAFKLITGAITLFNTITTAARTAMALFNATMLANPIALVIAAIVAVVAALVWFFTQTKLGQEIWAAFVSFLVSLWTSIVTTATTIFTSVMTFINNVWTSISTFATNTWNAIVATVTGIWNGFIAGAVAFATGLFNGIQSIWNGISGWVSGLWNGIVSTVIGVWNGFVSSATSFANSLFNGIKGVWNGITGWASSLWNGVKSAVSSIWSAIVSVVSSMAINSFNSLRGAWSGVSGFVSGLWNSARSAISGAWSGIVSTIRSMASNAFGGLRSAWGGVIGWVSGIWNSVKGAIMGAMNFSLFGAGSAIMNGFLNGLRSVWGAITSFVGGIASWIKAHKGPISYDKKLLIPAGNAIMTGFNSSLQSSFENVKKTVNGVAPYIAGAISGQGDYMINTRLSDNMQLDNGSLSVDMNNNVQPAIINLNMGGSDWRAHVNDISNTQGNSARLSRNNSVYL